MALLALHFSYQYKEKLLSGKKRHTVVDYALHLTPGQRLLVYLSESGKVEDTTAAKKIGVATITKAFIITVRDITDAHATMMGHATRKELIASMKKWYKITNSSIITYLEFNFESISNQNTLDKL